MKDQSAEQQKTYPCSPILLPSGSYMCPYDYRTWDVRKRESPCCVMCAVAWVEIEMNRRNLGEAT